MGNFTERDKIFFSVVLVIMDELHSEQRKESHRHGEQQRAPQRAQRAEHVDDHDDIDFRKKAGIPPAEAAAVRLR